MPARLFSYTCCITNVVQHLQQKNSDRAYTPATVGWFVSYQMFHQKSQFQNTPVPSFSREKYSSMSSSILGKLLLETPQKTG